MKKLWQERGAGSLKYPKYIHLLKKFLKDKDIHDIKSYIRDALLLSKEEKDIEKYTIDELFITAVQNIEHYTTNEIEQHKKNIKMGIIDKLSIPERLKKDSKIYINNEPGMSYLNR